MNQLPMFDEPAKDLRDEIIGRLTLQLEEEKDFTLKLVTEINEMRDALGKFASGPRLYPRSWMNR